MATGRSDDMRCTALVSVAAHVVFLGALMVMATVKAPPMGSSAIQVSLVSKTAVSSQEEPAPILQSSPAPVPQPQRLPEIPAPKEAPPIQKTAVIPRADAPKPVVHEPPAQQAQVRLPTEAAPDITETLRRAGERLRNATASSAVQPAAPAAVTSSRLRPSEEINTVLNQLPPQQAVSPVPVKPETLRLHALPSTAAPTAAVASRTTKVAVPRVDAMKDCPAKAQDYCAKLQRVIDQAWNADTDPAIRHILENAGDSTAIVRIVIQPNGEIRDIRVNKSSGNESYDRAVQSVLRELRHAPPLPEDMQGEPFVAVTSFTYMRKRDS